MKVEELAEETEKDVNKEELDNVDAKIMDTDEGERYLDLRESSSSEHCDRRDIEESEFTDEEELEYDDYEEILDKVMEMRYVNYNEVLALFDGDVVSFKSLYDVT